jgi:large subunit ribosomal protein L10
MEREQKATEIKNISEKFSKSKAAFLIDFKGMTVEQVTNLRKKLFPQGSEMKVVRNTLALRALKDHPAVETAIKDDFVGTNAVVFAYQDPSAAAKLLQDISKDVEQLQIKSGVMDGAKLDQERIKYLATLPSKEVLRAKLLGVFVAPMSKFLSQLQAPSSSFVRVLNAKKVQAESNN